VKKRLQSFWERRAPRERVVLGIAGLLLLALVIDRIALAPTRLAISRAKAELAGARSELDRVHASIDEQAQHNAEEIQARRGALVQRRARAEEVIRATQDELITPQQMQSQLAVILERFPKLRVVGLSVKPPVSLDVAGPEARPGKAPGSPAAPRGNAPGIAAVPASGLYEHGMEITISGRYLDLIAYLAALEHTPHRIYWRELQLSMDDKGTPVTRIGVFTLSREKTWLAL
jgi:MSHA biogenesis protein MshJ